MCSYVYFPCLVSMPNEQLLQAKRATMHSLHLYHRKVTGLRLTRRHVWSPGAHDGRVSRSPHMNVRMDNSCCELFAPHLGERGPLLVVGGLAALREYPVLLRRAVGPRQPRLALRLLQDDLHRPQPRPRPLAHVELQQGRFEVSIGIIEMQ